VQDWWQGRVTEICSGSDEGSYLRLIDFFILNSRYAYGGQDGRAGEGGRSPGGGEGAGAGHGWMEHGPLSAAGASARGTLSLSHTHALTHALTHTHTLTHSHTHTHTHTHTLTHSHTHTLTHSHTHTLTQTGSRSSVWPPSFCSCTRMRVSSPSSFKKSCEPSRTSSSAPPKNCFQLIL